MEHIEPNTLVMLDIPEKHRDCLVYYENLLGATNNAGLVLCLGEISNQKGHYIMVNKTDGTIVAGLHSDWFRLPTEDEL